MTTHIVILLVLFALSVLSGPTVAEQAQPADPPVRVRLTTSLGNIDLELYPEYAPATVANFLHLVDEGFYQGLIFHPELCGLTDSIRGLRDCSQYSGDSQRC